MNKFDKVLREAIAYVTEHGYDESAELTEIMKRLRRAAEESFLSDAKMLSQVNLMLENTFKRATTERSLKRSVPGIEVFTINRIMPQFRQELDKRIRANASLIRLNREEAIEKTLRRFSGWMTSIPEGGSRAIDKTDVFNDMSKASRQLKYENRRREIDQGHKLLAAIDDVAAKQSSAIAAKWYSHWEQAGYDYREDHKERDEKIFAIRGNWAIEQGFMNKGDGYTDEITMPAEEINCRCKYTYIISLSNLPDSMLTNKGRRALGR